MILPSGRIVSINEPIYPGSHFTWSEATKDGLRQIENLVRSGKLIVSALQIEKNIVLTATALDLMRSDLGNRPIHINSWYRPANINKSVGGKGYSRHLFGDAVDLRSDYYSPQQIAKVIEPNHNGGFHAYYAFCHIDWRGERARW
jgi:zinc D-Ala-D-Ala carboxypeptidase